MTKILIFLALFSINLQASDSTKIIIYGDDAYEPYSYVKNNNEMHGIYPNILRSIFKKMPEYTVELRPMPWNRALKALEKAEVFAIFPPYYRPSERPYIGQYSDPILSEEIVLFGHKKDALDPKYKNFPEGWYGKHFGMFLGTLDIAGPKFQLAVEQKNIKVSEEKGSDKNLILVGLKKRDAYINDRTAILYNLNKMVNQNVWPSDAEMPVEILSIRKEDGFVAFAKNNRNKYPYKAQFIKKFNLVLKELKQSGEIDRIINQYIQAK